MTDRRNGYRAPRRCPVCFSHEVWNFDQIPGNVVRACSRCKCRYLGRFEVDDDTPSGAPRAARATRAGRDRRGDAASRRGAREDQPAPSRGAAAPSHLARARARDRRARRQLRRRRGARIRIRRHRSRRAGRARGACARTRGLLLDASRTSSTPVPPSTPSPSFTSSRTWPIRTTRWRG